MVFYIAIFFLTIFHLDFQNIFTIFHFYLYIIFLYYNNSIFFLYHYYIMIDLLSIHQNKKIDILLIICFDHQHTNICNFYNLHFILLLLD
jgi:hypothetical protein